MLELRDRVLLLGWGGLDLGAAAAPMRPLGRDSRIPSPPTSRRPLKQARYREVRDTGSTAQEKLYGEEYARRTPGRRTSAILKEIDVPRTKPRPRGGLRGADPAVRRTAAQGVQSAGV